MTPATAATTAATTAAAWTAAATTTTRSDGRAAVRGAAIVLAGAVVLSLAYGPGYLGYDASWSLAWGADLAGGRLPDYVAPIAPTPHPLAILLGVPLSLLGDGSAAMLALTFVAFAALLAGLVALGAWTSWWPAGVIAATVIATRGSMGRLAGFASIDVLFLALVIWAAALEAQRPRRGAPVLGLLMLAGLLRPEAWLLSAVYCAWLVPALPRERRARAAVLAVAAPLLWALSDFAVTGNPLHSLTHTRELSLQLGRPTGLDDALTTLPDGLSRMLGELPLIAGLIGLVALLYAAARRAALPLAVAALGVVAWLMLGVSGLPLVSRYLLVVACMLSVVAGSAVVVPRFSEAMPAWVAAAAVVGILLASLPATITSMAAARDVTGARAQVHRDLESLAGSSAFRTAARRCPRIVVPDYRARTLLILRSRRVDVGGLPDGASGLLLTYASRYAQATFRLRARGEVGPQPRPPGARVVGRNASWVAFERCPG